MSASSDKTVIRFVVLFEGRSGSTYLIESLASHPQIRAEKEMLATIRKQVDRDAADASQQVGAVRALFAPGMYEYNVVGFKTKIKDILDCDELAKTFHDFETRVILLQRRNRIKLLVSLFNAMRLNEATGDWNLYQESDRQSKFRIDVANFKQWLDKSEQANRELNQYAAQLRLPALEIFYEDLLADCDSTFERICGFLDVPYRELRAGCIKNTSDDLRDVVENFDELKTEFVGTRYEHMFDEVLHSQP